MSCIELKTYKWTCDRCKTVVVTQSMYSQCPPGWGVEEVRGCGLTDYTRTDDRCPDCLPKTSPREI